MSYTTQTRIWADFQYGVLDDDLDIAETTVSSPAFEFLPEVVDGGDFHILLVLNPNSLNLQTPEIVKVVEHVADATTVEVERALYGTTEQDFDASITEWILGWTKSDAEYMYRPAIAAEMYWGTPGLVKVISGPDDDAWNVEVQWGVWSEGEPVDGEAYAMYGRYMEDGEVYVTSECGYNEPYVEGEEEGFGNYGYTEVSSNQGWAEMYVGANDHNNNDPAYYLNSRAYMEAEASDGEAMAQIYVEGPNGNLFNVISNQDAVSVFQPWHIKQSSGISYYSFNYFGTPDENDYYSKNKLFELDHTSTITVELPDDDTPYNGFTYIGMEFQFDQVGVGQIEFTPGAGVTLQCAFGTTKTRTQYSRATVIKVASNTWRIYGDLED